MKKHGSVFDIKGFYSIHCLRENFFDLWLNPKTIMKKLFFLFVAVLIGTYAMANDQIEKLDRKTINEMTVEERQERVIVLETRLDEISSVSFEALDKNAEKGVKKELKIIEKEMKMHQQVGGGLYISGGALLVIIILLILL